MLRRLGAVGTSHCDGGGTSGYPDASKGSIRTRESGVLEHDI